MNENIKAAIEQLKQAKALIDNAEAMFKAEGLDIACTNIDYFNDEREVEIHLAEGIEKVTGGKELQNRPPCFKEHPRWDDYDWVNVEGINFIQKKGEPR